jgi:histidine triad (HIT) family protein
MANSDTDDCIFCKIAAGDIPSNKIYEDDDVIAFHDLSPQAPVHVLIVPKKHMATLNDASDEDRDILGRLLLLASKLARQLEVGDGYRLINNCGASAGQSVFHIHFHLLGGRALGWPPG